MVLSKAGEPPSSSQSVDSDGVLVAFQAQPMERYIHKVSCGRRVLAWETSRLETREIPAIFGNSCSSQNFGSSRLSVFLGATAILAWTIESCRDANLREQRCGHQPRGGAVVSNSISEDVAQR